MENQEGQPQANQTPPGEDGASNLPANTNTALTLASAHDAIALDPTAWAMAECEKYGITEDVIADFKAKFSGLTIKDDDDKEGYDAVVAALSVLRPTRTGIEKKRKDIGEEYLTITNVINSEAKKWTKQICDIEDPLKKLKSDFDDRKQAAKLQSAEQAEAVIQKRIKLLTDNGATFDGSFYSIGENISLGVLDVRNMTDEGFETVMVQVVAEGERIAADKAEADRKAAEEAQAQKDLQKQLDQQKKDQEQAQRDLDKQKSDFEKQQSDLRNRVIEARRKSLQAIGFYYDGQRRNWYVTVVLGEVMVYDSTLQNADEATWMDTITDITAKVATLRQHQADKDQADQQAAKDEADRVAKEAADKEEADRLAAEQRAATIAPDIDKLAAYFAAVDGVPNPQLADDKLQARFNTWRQSFTTSIETFKANEAK